jgi:hypothetical protein
MKCGAHLKKRMNMKLGVNKGLEDILLEWFQQMYSENIPVSRPFLWQKAADSALGLKVDNFKAFDGWHYSHLKRVMSSSFLRAALL